MSAPEYVHSEFVEHECIEHPEYSHIVGVFKDSSQTAQAMEALKQANFVEDQIRLTEYDPQPSDEIEDELLQGTDRRFIVHVNAPGKEEEAVDILTHHGANNSDLPRGTALVHGKLLSTGAAAEQSSSGVESVTSILDAEQDTVNRLKNEAHMF